MAEVGARGAAGADVLPLRILDALPIPLVATPCEELAVQVRWYHGGVPGLKAGAVLVPSAPHVTDGCPICVARERGITMRVGVYRAWLQTFGEEARPALEALEGAPDWMPVDPPSERDGVYITTHRGYAEWYAARSGNGDLYEVEPLGEIVRSETDHFPSAAVPEALIRRVLRRDVRLTRAERRALAREWEKRDATAVAW